jgi:hypothetical protein
MRKTISRFTSSFAALLTDQTTNIDADGRTGEYPSPCCRRCEVDDSPALDTSKTWTDVMRASDIQTLWYLRSELLRSLSERHGEKAARQQLDTITEMFRGIVHKNQMPVAKPTGARP